MKINETVTKSFTFSCEDASIVYGAIVNRFGKMQIKSALENGRYYIPLLSAFGKISGMNDIVDYGKIRFSTMERNAICDLLRNTWREADDDDYKAKLLELLEGIFNN